MSCKKCIYLLIDTKFLFLTEKRRHSCNVFKTGVEIGGRSRLDFFYPGVGFETGKPSYAKVGS